MGIVGARKTFFDEGPSLQYDSTPLFKDRSVKIWFDQFFVEELTEA